MAVNDNRVNIETVFQHLSDISGFEGIVFISTKGAVLASKFPEGAASAKSAEAIAACLRDIENLILKIRAAGLEEMSIKGKLRSLLIIKSRSVGFLTALVGLSTMNLGVARIKTQEAMENLERTLDHMLTHRTAK